MKNIIIRRLKSEIKKFQHTILMKFVGPLAVIVHYTVQFNLDCCKSSVSNMDPNNCLKIIIRRLKIEFFFFKHTILMKFGGPLAITVHYTVQFNLECCKCSVSNMSPNTI